MLQLCHQGTVIQVVTFSTQQFLSTLTHVCTHTRAHTHFQPQALSGKPEGTCRPTSAPNPSRWNVKALSVHALSISAQDLKPDAGWPARLPRPGSIATGLAIPVSVRPVSSLPRGSAFLRVCDPLCSVPRPSPAGREEARRSGQGRVGESSLCTPPGSPGKRLKSRGSRSLSPCLIQQSDRTRQDLR